MDCQFSVLDDNVYMGGHEHVDKPAEEEIVERDKLLEEYVLNDVGKIWMGAFGSAKGREWIFGQFDDAVLPVAAYLL